MTKKPFFSVIMPTYNRAQFLPLAIKSVLSQTFEDFEIIISNGGSTDNTRDVVASFDDSRIRYIEAKEKLSISDNYQTGLDNATGEYISFLSDDDAFVPTMLERMKGILVEKQAQVITFRVGQYYQDTAVEHNIRISANSLEIPQFTGDIIEFSAKQGLENLYSTYKLNHSKPSDKFIVSYLANAVYHNSVFSRIKKTKSKIFETTPADMYLAAAIFYEIDKYFCLDEPLHVWSRWSGNATGLPSRDGNQLRERYEKLLNGQKLEFTPLKFPLPQNCCINAILKARHDFQKNNDEADINWSDYFINTYIYLLSIETVGVNINREIQEFKEGLLHQPIEIQRQVNSIVSSPTLNLKRFIRNNIPFVKRILEFLHRKDNLISVKAIINGNEAGFSNFLESAQFLGSNLSNYKNP